MFKTLLIGFLVSIIALYPMVLYGQEFDFKIPIEIPSNLESMIGLSTGDEAPFDGILIPTETAIFIFGGIEKKITDMEMELSFQLKMCNEECQFKVEMMASQMKQDKEEADVMLKYERERSAIYEKAALDNSSTPQWLIYGGGILTGVGLCLGTYFLVRAYQ